MKKIKIYNISGIYKITNVINGKFYIGSAVNLSERRSSHFSTLSKRKHKNSKLQNSWNKYGESAFIFEVLEIIKDKNILIEREQYYLDTLKPFASIGYNICLLAKSSLGVKRSKETKERISKSKTGTITSRETKIKLSIAGKGKKRSDKFKENLSKIRIGNKHTLGFKQSLDQIRRRVSATRKTLSIKNFNKNKLLICGFQ